MKIFTCEFSGFSNLKYQKNCAVGSMQFSLEKMAINSKKKRKCTPSRTSEIRKAQ